MNTQFDAINSCLELKLINRKSEADKLESCVGHLT